MTLKKNKKQMKDRCVDKIVVLLSFSFYSLQLKIFGEIITPSYIIETSQSNEKHFKACKNAYTMKVSVRSK